MNKNPVLLIFVLTFPAITWAEDPIREAVNAQRESIATSAEVQKRIDTLDDQTREMLNEYRQTLAQVQDLVAYNEQLQRLVTTQRAELSDFERQFDEIEITKRQILPLIVRMIEVLDEFVAIDIPFLERERVLRISELRALMERPEVPTSEKYRRISDRKSVV